MKNTKSHNPNAGVKVVAGLLVASQVTAIAEEASTPVRDTEIVETLEPTTVIATKFEKKLSEISSSVSVLDANDLRGEGLISLQDAIGYRVPGVISTSTAGQRGQLGSLFIRGMVTNKSQVRVDGVRLSSSTLNFGNFLGNSGLNGLSTVELLKGPASSKYGGEAIGGVLNITTAKGEGDPSAKITAEYGSYNSWVGSLQAQGQIDKLSYNLGVTQESTSNDPAVVGQDADYEQISTHLRLDYSLNDYSSIGGTFRVGDSSYETPGTTYQLSNYDYQLATLFYENQINKIWETKFTLGYSNQNFDILTSGFATDSEVISSYWDNSIQWSDSHNTTVGAFVEQTDFQTSSQFDRSDDRYVYGLYADHDWKVNKFLRVNGSLRWEDHSDYSDEVTWSAGAIYSLNESTNLKGNVGRAFRTPTFGELSGFPGNAFFSQLANPDLNPETTLGWDIGVEKKWKDVTVELTWFENDIEDAIASNGLNPSTQINQPGKTKTSGLEFSLNATIESLDTELFASYTTYQDRLNAIIPEQAATLGSTTQITEQLKAGATLTWVDERRLGDDLNSYFLVNLHAKYKLSDNVELHARVENLLDDEYILADFGNPVKGRGQGFYGGVSVSF